MDPLSLMMMLSKFGGQMGGAGAAGGTDSIGDTNPMGGLGGLGKALSGVEGTKAPEPKFSGGVSGSQLPFKTAITDMMSPAVSQMQSQQKMLPSLGALLAMAPGGGA